MFNRSESLFLHNDFLSLMEISYEGGPLSRFVWFENDILLFLKTVVAKLNPGPGPDRPYVSNISTFPHLQRLLTHVCSISSFFPSFETVYGYFKFHNYTV